MASLDKHSLLPNTPVPPITTASAMEKKREARYSLLLFFILLLLFTAVFDGLLLITQAMMIILFLLNVFLVMWTPALAALLTRLIRHESLKDLPFRFWERTTLRGIAIALLTPVVIGLISYGIAWLTGLEPLLPFHPTGGLQDFISLAGPTSQPIQLFLALLYLTVISLVAAAGEEIGWRGYMLTRLIDSKFPIPVLISGLIWSLWHWPQILVSPPVASQPQIVTASIFLVTITSLGFVSAYLRLKTGSLWPSIILHAAWNSIIVELFNAFTRGLDTSLWTGEPGILVALTMVIAAYIFSHGIHKILHPSYAEAIKM